MLERAVIELDGSSIIQALPVFAESDIAAFIASDIYREQLAERYAAITNRVSEFFERHA